MDVAWRHIFKIWEIFDFQKRPVQIQWSFEVLRIFIKRVQSPSSIVNAKDGATAAKSIVTATKHDVLDFDVAKRRCAHDAWLAGYKSD